MGVWLKIAWRNILRNKRRSGLTIFGIAASTAALFFFLSLNNGFNAQMVKANTDLYLSHLAVQPEGFQKKIEVEKRFRLTPEARAAIEGLPGFRHLAERVKFTSFVSSPRNNTGVLVVGLDPADARTHTVLPESLKEGTFLEDEGRTPSVVVGKDLADTLSVELGDKIVLMNQASDGSLANDLYRVRGITRTGIPSLDKGVVYIPIENARRFVAYGPDEVSEAAIFLEKSSGAAAARDLLREKLRGLDLGRQAEVLSWQELAPEIQQMVEMNDFFNWITAAIIFFVVTVGVMNTLLMAVFERTRELGVMMAVGTKPRQVVGTVMLESFLLGVAALLFGNGAGFLITRYYGEKGINFAQWSEGLASFLGSSTTIHPAIFPETVMQLTAGVFVVAMFSALWPAARAARLRPVDAIRNL